MMERICSARPHLGWKYLRFAMLSGAAGALFAGSLFAQARASSSTAAGAPLAELQKLLDHGRAAEVLAQLDVIAAKPPIPAGVQRMRGLALYAQNKMPVAEQAFAAAMVDDPSDKTAAQMRGITLYRLGRPVAAIPLLEAVRQQGKLGQNAAEHATGPVDPQYVLALCYVDTQRYDDARHAFATQYGFPDDSAAAYLLTARMLLRREFIPVAQQFARKALELSPQLPLAHRLLGETELADNHLAEAVADFEQERAVDPLDPITYDRLGDAYVRQGDFDKARLALQEAVLLEPNSTGPFILLGKVLLKQQDPLGASAFLEHARDMDPQNYMTHSLLGQSYRQMGRPEDARAETAMAEKLQGDTAPKLDDVK